MNPHTLTAARHAAGAAVAATDAVIAGELENAFCCARPPGHHAEPDRAMGFCFFDNVAIAARHALTAHGLSRVAIVDFDVHHGNGTEAAFRDDPQVLMCSFFQHPFYPYSGTEHLRRTCRTSRCPRTPTAWPCARSWKRSGCRAERIQARDAVYLRRLRCAPRGRSRPDGLVEQDYAWITQQLVDVARAHAKGRIVSCLEAATTLAPWREAYSPT
jgi:acetoin utilization deacetylase AcuC-like enzyme